MGGGLDIFWGLSVRASLMKYLDKPRQHIKKQRHHFADKGPSSQSHGFSSMVFLHPYTDVRVGP